MKSRYRIRKLVITKPTFDEMTRIKDKAFSERTEDGGTGYGYLYPNGTAFLAYVKGAGPHSIRSSAGFTTDSDHISNDYQELRRSDPNIRLLFDYHVHPWEGDATPSSVDKTQLINEKPHRPWFLTPIFTKNDFRIWDFIELDNEDHPTLQEAPHLIVSDIKGEEQLLDRIQKSVKNDVLIKSTVTLAGTGSLGSALAKYIGCTGIGRIIIIDNENLETANVIRHEGGIEDIGKPKVEICKRIIESHNPFTVVDTYNFDITKDLNLFERCVDESDLIIASSGSPKVNHIINKVSIEKKKPVIYGGVYERASGGYALASLPGETACFNCIFGLGSEAYAVDKEEAKRYGLDEFELHQQQGLWADISFISLIMCKMSLAALQGEVIVNNLVLYDSSFDMKKLFVAKRKACASCDPESWIEKQAQSSRKNDFLKKIREKLRFFMRRSEHS